MNYKRLYHLVVLVALLVVTLVPLQAQTGTFKTYDGGTQVSTETVVLAPKFSGGAGRTQINFGFIPVATPTVTLDDVTAVDVGDYLPTGCTGFELRCKSGAFVITHGDNIATGTDRIGRLVSAGESYTWKGAGGYFDGKMISNSVNRGRLRRAWGYYR